MLFYELFCCSERGSATGLADDAAKACPIVSSFQVNMPG